MQRQNIQVAARIRPLAELVSFANEQKVVCAFGSTGIRVDGESEFQFDLALGEDKDQVEVFESVAKHIVEGCIDGYNGTIFAYGLTGSGKTYTMVGPGSLYKTLRSCPEKRGLIPRAAELMFLLLHGKQEEERDAFCFEVKCTFVQLYMEKLYDLLKSGRSSGSLEIRLDGHGNMVLFGAEERTLNSVADLISVVDEGLAQRNVAETAMNRESSRSHAILTLTVKTTLSNERGIVVHKLSRLNLVDLAGSERQSDALSVGERLKEASAINSSLLMLGRVIRALSDPNYKQGSYVAYRDSKLTLLLKDSLGGNAQTAVIVTLHSNRRFLEETFSTLKFAQQVKKVKNHIVVNEDLSGQNVDAWKSEIHRLHEELLESKRQIEQMKLEAEKKSKLLYETSNASLEQHYQKILEEKNSELKELKARYLLSVNSFELLRRYNSAPDETFEAIEEYKKRFSDQLAHWKENWSSLHADDIGFSQTSQVSETEEANRAVELEMKLNDERLAHDVTKARYDTLRKRLSMCEARASTATGAEAKTPSQLKKERRMTRFTMGTSSYDSMHSPIANGNHDRVDFFQDTEDAAPFEEERLKLECENNRLVQINEDLEEQLFRLQKTKTDAMCKIAEKNEKLEEAVGRLQAEADHWKVEYNKLKNDQAIECDVLQKTCRNLKATTEKQSAEISLLNEEKDVLSRSVVELKEMNEALETENMALKAQKVGTQEQANQDGMRLLELESRLTDLQNELDHRADKLNALKERADEEEKRASDAEMALRVQRQLIAEKELRLEELIAAQENHESELYSKQKYIEELQKQLELAEKKIEESERSFRGKLQMKDDCLEKMNMEHEALTQAAMELFDTSKRRRSGFINGLDALSEVARILELKEKEVKKKDGKINELEKELQIARRKYEEVADHVETLVKGDRTFSNKVHYMKNLRDEVYTMRNRIAQLEKELLEYKKDPVKTAGRMVTRSAAARQSKAKRDVNEK